MDRESLTLQIENMKFQSKMERWPLSKSIEAWVSTRVLQFWHQSALWPSFVDISCMSKSKLENSNSVCTNKMQSDLIEGVLNFCLFSLPQSDCVNYIDIKNIWLAGFLFLLFSFEFLYWTFQACHFLYQVKENNSFQCRWTFIFQEFTEMLFHLISFLGWKPSLKKMRNLTFWFIPLIRELIRGWKR